MKKFAFPKSLILSNKKELDLLFNKGQSTFAYPIKLIYRLIPTDQPTVSLQCAVSVPKKTFKKAVQRNLLKRRMREALRHHKKLVLALDGAVEIHLIAIYVGKEIIDYQRIENAIRSCLMYLNQKINTDDLS